MEKEKIVPTAFDYENTNDYGEPTGMEQYVVPFDGYYMIGTTPMHLKAGDVIPIEKIDQARTYVKNQEG